MKILVINAGSSTLKFQLFEMDNNSIIARGNVERIGEGKSFLKYKTEGKNEVIDTVVDNHKEAMNLVIRTITDKKIGVIKNIKEINAFGHRVVNAGDKYFDPIVVDEKILQDFRNNTDFSPLHMPGSIAGIEACINIAKHIPSVAVFDIGFHKTMPEYVFRYAIPNEYYEKYKVRRYGAHGTSHYFVAREAAKFLGADEKDFKVITCHLGSGASITAVKNGKCFDTSMGFTPLEGIIMNTRSGDIDPAVVEFLCNKTGKSVSEIIRVLNKESGIYGLNNGVADMRELENRYDDKHIKLILDMYAYRIRKYIGSYTAAMNGLDALVFTAGIGENTPILRELITNEMDFFGVKVNKDKNWGAKRGATTDISAEDSRVKVLVLPTNEELVIAEETQKIVSSAKKA